MFFRAKRALERAWFNFNSRPLLNTAPLRCTDEETTIVSMLCNGEVMMYLLAVKSFCAQLGRSPKVVILDDGSLTDEDRSVLRKHIPHVGIVQISEVAPDDCPKRNCWERLLLIGDLAKDSYIIQLDSDTLTMRPIPEVLQCIQANRSFTLLGDRSYPEIEPMQSACNRLRNNTSSAVQSICERGFDQLPESGELRYVRGNAGFTGFARTSIDREKIVRFSKQMRRIAHEKWDEWGSEQVASNLLIANSDKAYVLPFPKYLSYWAHPDVSYDEATFIHFIGPHRFSNGFYVQCAKKAIQSLAASGPA